MKCKLCSKKLTKSDYWAGIRYSRLLWFIFGYVTDFFLLLYWKIKGTFEDNINKKTVYMHFSCFKKQDIEKKRFYTQPITYTQHGKKIVYIGLAAYPFVFILAIVFLALKLGMQSRLFFEIAMLFTSVFILGLFIGVCQIILLDMAAGHIRDKLKFR